MGLKIYMGPLTPRRVNFGRQLLHGDLASCVNLSIWDLHWDSPCCVNVWGSRLTCGSPPHVVLISGFQDFHGDPPPVPVV